MSEDLFFLFHNYLFSFLLFLTFVCTHSIYSYTASADSKGETAEKAELASKTII